METQKYYVMKNEGAILCKNIYGLEIAETQGLKIKDMFDSVKKDYQLTEQEIKSYNEEYMKYAVPVRKGWND